MKFQPLVQIFKKIRRLAHASHSIDCFVTDTGYSIKAASIQKLYYMRNVFLRLLFVGIVPAIGKHSKFTLGEIPIKFHTLFNFKKKTPVRIEH